MSTAAHEPGRTAYEARFAGHTLRPRGVAEAWEDLLPVHQAIWARVEEAVRAMSRPAEQEAELRAHLYTLSEDSGWTSESVIDRLFGLVGIPREADDAAPPPAEATAGLDEAVALFRRTLPHWTTYSIHLHSRGGMTRFIVEISRLQQDRIEALYCESGPTAVEAMQNVIASVPEASRQPDAPPAEGRAD